MSEFLKSPEERRQEIHDEQRGGSYEPKPAGKKPFFPENPPSKIARDALERSGTIKARETQSQTYEPNLNPTYEDIRAQQKAVEHQAELQGTPPEMGKLNPLPKGPESDTPYPNTEPASEEPQQTALFDDEKYRPNHPYHL